MMSYADAVALLGKRETKKLAHATYLERGPRYTIDPITGEAEICCDGGRPSFNIVYHRTAVVTIIEGDFYILRNGGWYTATTKKRLEEYAPVWIEGRVEPYDDGDWWLRSVSYAEGTTAVRKSRIEFSEGMVVNRDGAALDFLSPEVL